MDIRDVLVTKKKKLILSKVSSTYGTEGVDDQNESFFVVLVAGAGLFADKSPQLVYVDNGAVLGVTEKVEVSQTNLSKVTRMVFVHVDTVVMLTTSKTTTSRMLAVLT